MDTEPQRTSAIRHRWVLPLVWGLLLLAAAGLRWPGVAPDLAAPHADGYNFVLWPLLILLGETTPPVFYYPHLSYYLLAGLNALQLAFVGGESFTDSVLRRFLLAPETSLALARGATALCGAATVAAVGLLARGAGLGRGGALWAGALMAVCVVHLRQSPVAGADVLMTLLFTLAVWSAIRLQDRSAWIDSLAVGLLVGLAAAVKYQGALAGAAVLVVHLAARRPLWDGRLVAAGAAAAAVFLLATPGIWLDPQGFGTGFRDLWLHVAPGGTANAPGWWRHLRLSLWHAWGPAGLFLCLAGVVLACRERRPAPLALAVTFVLYYSVAGSARLTYVRYALPLMPLAAVLVVRAAHTAGDWAQRRARARVPWTPLLLLLALLPGLYGSARIADLRRRPDTRIEAARWMSTRLAPGTVVCNFGGWAGDPPARTVEDLWWRLSHLVRTPGTPTVAEALAAVESSPLPATFLSYVVQPGNRALAAGAPATVSRFGCDCVIAHRHALPASSAREDLGRHLAMPHRVTFDPDPGGGPGPDPARYDRLDALFVPLAGFGRVVRAGPHIDIWAETSALAPAPAWGARDLFARALMRGARSLLDQGEPEPALHLLQQALSLVPATRDARLFHEAADVFQGLGLEEPARRSAERAAALAGGR